MNFLITPLDGVLTEITNDASGLAGAHHIDLAANLYFGIGSTIFVAIVLTFISARLVEKRLGTRTPPTPARTGDRDRRGAPEVSPEDEARGLRYALWATLAVVVVITLLTAIPGAPLRDPVTGKMIGDSPFMDSLIVIITLIFFAAGYAYGRGAGTIKGSADVHRRRSRSPGPASRACSSCSC